MQSHCPFSRAAHCLQLHAHSQSPKLQCPIRCPTLSQCRTLAQCLRLQYLRLQCPRPRCASRSAPALTSSRPALPLPLPKSLPRVPLSPPLGTRSPPSLAGAMRLASPLCRSVRVRTRTRTLTTWTSPPARTGTAQPRTAEPRTAQHSTAHAHRAQAVPPIAAAQRRR
jgi:hypothetical protein